MITSVSIRKIAPNCLIQKLATIIPDFNKASEEELLLHVYNWGLDRVNYYYNPGSLFASIQMSIQIKSYPLTQKQNVTVDEVRNVLIEAFALFNKK
jgi:hypothetical protein